MTPLYYFLWYTLFYYTIFSVYFDFYMCNNTICVVNTHYIYLLSFECF